MYLEKEKGGSLVELIIVVAIIVGALTVILGLAAFSVITSGITKQTVQATALAEEAIEAVRNYRETTGWNDDNAGIEYDGLGVLDFDLAPFHLEKSASTTPRWRMISGAETVNGFTRTIFFDRLNRDANDDIVPVGTPDSDSVEVLVRVSWQERGRTHEIELASYLMNWNQ